MAPEPQVAIVIFAVADLARSRAFYERAFGWRAGVVTPSYVELATGSTSVGLYARSGFAQNTGQPAQAAPSIGTTSAELYVHVDDARAAADRVLAAGGRPLDDVRRRPWGDVAAYFADPDGNVVAVAQRGSVAT